jgi:hypothetical protein
MNKFFKFLTISTILSLLPNSAGVQACWMGFEYDRYNFRFWLLPMDLIPMQAIQTLSYTQFKEDFNGWERNDIWAQCPFDTTFYTQNVAEWQAALGATSKVDPKDIHKILYNTQPDVFFRQMRYDSLSENTFIRAVQRSYFYQYLNYAKTCEQLMGVEPWDDGKKRLAAIKKHFEIGQTMLYLSTTHPFVRERTAYQLVKLSHYLGDTAKTMALYKQYFEKPRSKSWIYGSASYYDALAHQNPLVRNALLADVFESSIDKREAALKMLDTEEDVFRKSLAMTRSPQEKARMMLLPLIKKQGRTLTDLQLNYQVEPRNHLLPLAIQLEINKLENWIFTNHFTEYVQSSAKSKDFVYDENIGEQTEIDARNLKSDLLYFDQFLGFVKTVIAERKQPNRAYWNLAAAHLSFLKKDFASAKQYLTAVQTENKNSNSIQLQAALTELLCDLYAAPRLNAENETAILKFDAYLQQNKQNIFDYTTFRSQIMRFLSERFIQDGQVAKGLLILSKSNLTYGSIINIWEKNFYHSIFETNDPQIVTQVIDIVTRKKKATDFERWLAAEPKPYKSFGYHYESQESTYGDSDPETIWSISKLKDYQSMIYIKQDKLDSAYAVLKTIPETHWTSYPYSTYLVENPFQYVGHLPDRWPDDSLPKAMYSKTTFVKRLLELKQQLKSDPKKFEQNYFLIGTAYYNMTYRGNFWLMSEIAWNRGCDTQRTDWNDIYFGCTRAADWFAKGVANCSQKENAAMCCFMANVCQKQQDKYDYEIKYDGLDFDKRPDFKQQQTPLWATLKKRFKGANGFETQEYWCQHLNAMMSAIDK